MKIVSLSNNTQHEVRSSNPIWKLNHPYRLERMPSFFEQELKFRKYNKHDDGEIYIYIPMREFFGLKLVWRMAIFELQFGD